MSKESEALRKAAVYMRKHGFSPEYDDGDGCGCFIHAGDLAAPSRGFNFTDVLPEVTGCGLGENSLRNAGWTRGCTDDAVAALLIAADLAE